MVKKRVPPMRGFNRAVGKTKLLQDSLARKAFDQLTKKWGVDGDKLLDLVLTIPYCPDEVLPIVEGMGDIAVRKLPDRIRVWADSIEKINSSPWLRPDQLVQYSSVITSPELFPEPFNVILTPDKAGLAANSFKSLPDRLRDYADYLEVRLRLFHPTGPERRKLGYKQLRWQTWRTLELLRLVRDAGHGPRLKEVAILLNTAYLLAGKRRDMSEDNLSKLETNNPWFTFVLREASLREHGRHNPNAAS
jgi:hypothetical protein